ncbi:MAG: hypothetical protein ACE5HN_00015 [Nitrospiria bacterium]
MKENDPAARRYKVLRERLWNQPRARRFLERLERHHARPALLEVVARLFVEGSWGEAEIRSAIYYDLLRHRDRADLIRRISELRRISTEINRDLLYLAKGFYLARDRRACARKLGLPERVMGALIAIRQNAPSGLDPLLEELAEAYAKGSHRPSHEAGASREAEQGLIIELKRVAEMKSILAMVHENLLHLIRELDQIKGWEAYRTVGYGDFSEFAMNELGLSEQVAGMLVKVRRRAEGASHGELLRVITQWLCALRFEREGEEDAGTSF